MCFYSSSPYVITSPDKRICDEQTEWKNRKGTQHSLNINVHPSSLVRDWLYWSTLKRGHTGAPSKPYCAHTPTYKCTHEYRSRSFRKHVLWIPSVHAPFKLIQIQNKDPLERERASLSAAAPRSRGEITRWSVLGRCRRQHPPSHGGPEPSGSCTLDDGCSILTS